MNAFTPAVLVTLVLMAACAPPPPPPPVAPIAGIDPVTGLPVDVTPGLNEREPDTCKAADHIALLGQQAPAIQTAGITKTFRVVSPGAIVSQEEYNSFRVNFYLDGTGKIVRINCG